MADTKTCTKCGKTMPATLEYFYADSHRPGRLANPCKECRLAYEHAKYWANPATARFKKRADRRRRADEQHQYDQDLYQMTREKKLEQKRAYRERNFFVVLEREREKGRRRYAEGRAIYEEWKASGCIVCGFDFMPAIEAHHLDGNEKLGNPSQMLLRHAALREELSKSVPLCANHHAVATHLERHGVDISTSERLIAEVKAIS
jgi:hypothetical protein